MRDTFLVFGAPLIEQAEIDEVVATLKSGWLGTGPKTHKFEEDFRAYKGAKFTIGLSSCTAALHLALKAIGVTEGDEVIVPSITFAASANVVVHCGATPVFADCDRSTMNIDPVDVERKITGRTKAIMVVHMAGRMCDMDAIMIIAKKHSLKVVEDAAHAVETELDGKKAGTIGDIGCFSFHPIKNISMPDGGLIATDNEEYAKKIRVLSLHGMSADAWDRYGKTGYKHYEIVEAGFKYNMTDVQASVGIHQLARVEKNWTRRDELWKYYMRELAGLPIILPAPIQKGTRHAYHLFTILIDTEKAGMTRDQFLLEIKKRNIGTGVHFTATHLQPFYRKEFKYKEGDLPNSEWIGSCTVSIPLSAKVTDEDAKDVVEAIRDIFA